MTPFIVWVVGMGQTNKGSQSFSLTWFISHIVHRRRQNTINYCMPGKKSHVQLYVELDRSLIWNTVCAHSPSPKRKTLDWTALLTQQQSFDISLSLKACTQVCSMQCKSSNWFFFRHVKVSTYFHSKHPTVQWRLLYWSVLLSWIKEKEKEKEPHPWDILEA